MLKRYRFRDYDFMLVLLVVALTVIGIFAIGSAADEGYQKKQILGLVLGLFAMVVISMFDYTVLIKFQWVFYVASLIMLALIVQIGPWKGPLGKEVNGAYRWMEFKGITFQPSEATKILLILFFAQFIMKYKERINTFKILALACLLFAPQLILVLEEPDLSTSIVLVAIFATLFFVGGLSYKIIAGLAAVGIPLFFIVFYLIIQPGQKLIDDYQQLRILAWLDKEKYATSAAYQQLNSMMAIGSGRLWGKGYKNNIVASVKNGNFISEPQTDFIFSVIGEELGFLGTCAVVILIMLIAIKCVSIARKAKDMAGKVIAAGIAALVGFQGFFNIGVTTGLLPNTGLTLPFVSAGLTSLVTIYAGIGIVLNVRLQAKKYETSRRGQL